ncbi:thioredoxin domain-containing protein [Candidatus Contubernalis alkaliaceticus]|uniref:thioredoxin domain-containing protein n=1 Tax=Candidatus Contubernalis alkaliaceticus TaxID=338645 RepID=UPI001F4BFC10|nr:thioredoxin domain-containing protein [Candidatus Contubernalis alkalaceticus]UNC92268.1 thioredoxin domain-containing protein [Candidatus Contubernalis alkalaceticus]
MNKENRLIFEKSPYLLQHAYNPVDWYPWGNEAFEKALQEDKPIFLSIGYSTCHWCHVMERESFEKEDAAEILNKHFVCIKVDREERPDVDSVYMTVCQAMTGRGGWPLTIFLTPDKKPFFAGTYFPKKSIQGRPGLMELVDRVAHLWKNEREDLLESAENLLGHLKKNIYEKDEVEISLGIESLDEAYDSLAQRFDKVWGGFGSAPKFPTPHYLTFLLRYHKRTGEEKALEMVEKTLENMSRGGIYDHLGYGFHRYSTNREWLLPHFEKMLYDQALLSMAYIEAYQVTGKEDYRDKVKEIMSYVLRDMVSAEGGFYSAEDADSEGEEGKFYVWETREMKEILEENQYNIAARVFNTRDEGNFRDEATGKRNGKNILFLKKSVEELARELKIDKALLKDEINNIKNKLFIKREKRIRPHLDDKILTDWNGLMIAAMARAGSALKEEKYIRAARKAADFVLTNLRTPQGRLLKSYREGPSNLPGHADDYAFLIWGLLELYEATFKGKYLENALRLNDILIHLFWDKEIGGLYFTAEDSEDLPLRPKEIYDGAIPSANSVTALNLIRLARLTGDTSLEKKSVQIGNAFAGEISQHPAASTQFLSAIDFTLGPAVEIVIVGEKQDPISREMLDRLYSSFVPNKVIIFKDIKNTEEEKLINELAPYTREQKSLEGKTTAYVCRNFSCLSPIHSPEQLFSQVQD